MLGEQPDNRGEKMSFQAYLDTIKEKTGKSPEDFRVLAEARGLLRPGVKAGEVLVWLKEDFGLGHGHAMALYGTLNSTDEPRSTVDEQVAKHFGGRKAGWRQSYDQLVTEVKGFGPDVSVQPTNSYISIVRGGKKFAIVATSADRLDVGIKLKGFASTERLTASGAWNAMVTHRVRLDSPSQIDAELLGWLHVAYERA
jgi:hypothetical protein